MTLKNCIALLMTTLTSCSSPQLITSIKWSQQNLLPASQDGKAHPGVAGPIAAVVDNYFVLAGGANFLDKMPWEGGTKNYSKDLYLYEVHKDGLHLIDQQILQHNIAYAGTCSINDKIYIAGGENELGPTDQVSEWTFTNRKLTIKNLPSLPEKLTNGQLVEANDILYFVGGENQQKVSSAIFALDLKSQQLNWNKLVSLPDPVSNAVVLSNQKDILYVAGGRKKNQDSTSTIYDQIYKVDLITKDISSIGTIPKAIAAGTGILTKNGNIVLFGGDDAQTFHQVESLIAKINKSSDPQEKELLNSKKADIQSKHPGFIRNVWKFDVSTKKWSNLDNLPSPSAVTTSAILFHNQIFIPSGEIKAGVRSNQIIRGIF